MCGIAGIILLKESHDRATRRLKDMTRIIEHRGPDDRGEYIGFGADSRFVGLGHRRLSIIDLVTGHQPMANDDESVWIVYNGEIYNHLEIRRELEALGYRYKSKSDTETVLHAYEEYGEDCLQKFRGMFAFAIWDNRRKRLFAARDRLGIKPFYYTYQNGTLLFASEIKSILASGLVEPAVDHLKLPEYFSLGQTVDHATLFQNINKLMPGHWLSFDGGELTIQRYWDWQFDESEPVQPERYFVERFDELFEQSVRSHLIGDVPLGVFLSGGLDSSLIAAVMARYMTTPVQAFTVGFENKYYSEFVHARKVASYIGADYHEVTVTPEQFFDVLPKLIWHEDEPLKGAASVALYFVSQLARSHAKVVLTGEGSDELFAGYNDRYWCTLLNQRLAKIGGGLPETFRRNFVRKVLWDLPLPLQLKKKISHTILYLSDKPEGIFFDNFHGIFSRDMQQELLDEKLQRRFPALDPYVNALKVFERPNLRHYLHRLLYADVNVDLHELLMKQDQMSMAASVESRVPFLDHGLVEFAGTLPPPLRLRGRSGKWIVKKVAEKYLPRDIIHRPKMGFPVPFSTWLKEETGGFVRDVLFDPGTRQRGYFNFPYIEKLFQWHREGRRDCHSQLWMLLNFELWQRVFFDDNGGTCPARHWHNNREPRVPCRTARLSQS
jgi:asparagine synthase (glutamine-hydrolysing)